MPLKVNVRSPKGASLAEAHGITGVPAIEFMDGKGNVVHDFVGYRNAAEMLSEMKAAKN